MFINDNARDHFYEVDRYQWAQLEYDPTMKSFPNFLSFSKTAKQALD